MNFLKLTKDKLDLNAINELVVHESCGAVSFFTGITRDNFENKQVALLEYEAYEPMAIKALTKICDDIRSRWPDVKHIAIYHRLGVVPVKECSVVIAVSSPHRQSSLEAVQLAIEDLKKTVPIWKKEIYGGANEDSIPSISTTSAAPQTRKRIKRSADINFDVCCPIDNDVIVPKHLLQIRADETEIKRRVNCFIERKREEIDVNNVLDFIAKPTSNSENEEDSCARVRSTIYRVKGSTSHLKVHRVKNECGPQTRSNYTDALDKLMENASSFKIKTEPDTNDNLAIGVNERLRNAEKFLDINPVAGTKNVYERLKSIENRLLYLETVSPEYMHFLSDTKKPGTTSNFPVKTVKKEKKSYSIDELNDLIHKLEGSKS